MERIGIRELRQHASRHLKRVARGETIEITDRGRPVARLVPVTGDTWADLVASGVVREAEVAGDVLDEEPRDHHIDASGQLRALRHGER